jgi:hypothetical protein
MLIGLPRLLFPAVFVGAVGLQPAYADIYTWVDAKGTINVSNLAPPDGAQVINVIHAAATADPAGDQAAQMRALAERVVQLQDEVESAQRPMGPPAFYPPVPPPMAPPPMVQYITEVQAPAVQYVVNAPAPASTGCDSTMMDCGYGWGWAPVFYPTTVVVLRPPYFSRPRPPKGGPHFAAQQPMQPPVSGWRRG